jgi:2-(1,2-epoxy-1,2-dihydrophenyl)acetyl-CoA isomerase
VIDAPLVVVERPSDNIAIFTINRPDVRNATDRRTSEILDESLTQAEHQGLRCVIVTGAGDLAFSAGNDVQELQRLSGAQAAQLDDDRQRWTWHWMNTPVITVAALNGLAYGNGAILAMTSDLRVGARNCSLKVTATGFGGANDTWVLPSLIGWSAAKDLLLTGRAVQADELHSMGLLNRLVDRADLLPTALALAEEIAANPPSGVQAVKRLTHQALGLTLRERFDREAALQADLIKSSNLNQLFKPATYTR